MVAFRPPEKSFGQKLAESLFVQLTLVALIGIIAVYFITRNQKQNFWSRVQFLRGSTQISSSLDANDFSQKSVSSQQDITLNQDNVVAPETPRDIAENGRTVAHKGPQATILYLEVPQQILSKWLEEGLMTRVESVEGITIGYIPQLAQVLEQYKSQLKVVKEERYQYALNQLYTAKLDSPPHHELNQNRNTASVPGGAVAAPHPNTNLNVVAYATLDDDRNDTLTGQLEISLNPQVSFPAQFEMPPDQSFFISGFNKALQPEKATLNETVVVFKVDK